MKLVVCVDDNMGMSFNSRRVSQDSEVVNRIRSLACKEILWMSGYSVRLFLEQSSSGGQPDSVHVCISDEPEKSARADDYCFVENRELNLDTIKNAKEIVLFRWNRKYPSDVKFTIPLELYWTLKKSVEFSGTSHDKITMEVWNHV